MGQASPRRHGAGVRSSSVLVFRRPMPRGDARPITVAGSEIASDCVGVAPQRGDSTPRVAAVVYDGHFRRPPELVNGMGVVTVPLPAPWRRANEAIDRVPVNRWTHSQGSSEKACRSPADGEPRMDARRVGRVIVRFGGATARPSSTALLEPLPEGTSRLRRVRVAGPKGFGPSPRTPPAVRARCS